MRLTQDAKNGASAGKWCYIDETGKQTIEQTFEQADPFSEGRAAVKQKGQDGLNRQAG